MRFRVFAGSFHLPQSGHRGVGAADLPPTSSKSSSIFPVLLPRRSVYQVLGRLGEGGFGCVHSSVAGREPCDTMLFLRFGGVLKAVNAPVNAKRHGSMTWPEQKEDRFAWHARSPSKSCPWQMPGSGRCSGTAGASLTMHACVHQKTRKAKRDCSNQREVAESDKERGNDPGLSKLS